jgi:hypothetical protein
MSLKGRVAGIINERELAINIGIKEGVKKGMKFKVLSSEPYLIQDPETGKELGKIDRPKVSVKVSEVFEEFSICETYRKKTIGSHYGSFASGSIVDTFLSSPKIVTETLKFEDSELPPPLSEEESYVKSGDRVVQISEDK